MNGAPEAVVQVEIELEDGRRSVGATAELMVPKWFNKDPKLSPDETSRNCAARCISRASFISSIRSTPRSGCMPACYDHQIARCARADIPPLAAGYGPAQLDKAILDALLRAQGLDIFTGLKQNVAGLDARHDARYRQRASSTISCRRARRPRASWSVTPSACSIRWKT